MVHFMLETTTVDTVEAKPKRQRVVVESELMGHDDDWGDLLDDFVRLACRSDAVKFHETSGVAIEGGTPKGGAILLTHIDLPNYLRFDSLDDLVFSLVIYFPRGVIPLILASQKTRQLPKFDLKCDTSLRQATAKVTGMSKGTLCIQVLSEDNHCLMLRIPVKVLSSPSKVTLTQWDNNVVP